MLTPAILDERRVPQVSLLRPGNRKRPNAYTKPIVLLSEAKDLFLFLP